MEERELMPKDPMISGTRQSIKKRIPLDLEKSRHIEYIQTRGWVIVLCKPSCSFLVKMLYLYLQITDFAIEHPLCPMAHLSCPWSPVL